MKRKINSKLIIMSAAVAVLTMTSLLTGCSSKKGDEGDLSETADKPYQTTLTDDAKTDSDTTTESAVSTADKKTGTNTSMNTAKSGTVTTVKKSEGSSDEEGIMDQSAFDQEFNDGQVSGNVSSGDNESYDQQAYENLGIKVYLHGTNEEQAQQWADALNEAYPNLNMTCNGNASGPAIPPNEDKYTMSPEEIDAKIMEALGGKDWHDCNIGELANAIPWCGGTELGMEISLYFGEQTARSFNWGDYHIIG